MNALEEFNLAAPFTATVIFDEDDEDIDPVIANSDQSAETVKYGLEDFAQDIITSTACKTDSAFEHENNIRDNYDKKILEQCTSKGMTLFTPFTTSKEIDIKIDDSAVPSCSQLSDTSQRLENTKPENQIHSKNTYYSKVLTSHELNDRTNTLNTVFKRKHTSEHDKIHDVPKKVAAIDTREPTNSENNLKEMKTVKALTKNEVNVIKQIIANKSFPNTQKNENESCKTVTKQNLTKSIKRSECIRGSVSPSKPNVDTYSDKTEVLNNNSQKENNMYTINIQVNSATGTSDPSQIALPHIEIHNMMSNCLKKLLYTVSEHMMIVMMSYDAYIKSAPSSKQTALKKYLETRHRFFDLSYSTVANIIIPRKNDATFVKNFLHDTVAVFRTKSLKHKYEHIEPLFADMIKWVERRQIEIRNWSMNLPLPNNLNQSPSGSQQNLNLNTENTTTQQQLTAENRSRRVQNVISGPACNEQLLQNALQSNRPPPPAPNPTHSLHNDNNSKWANASYQNYLTMQQSFHQREMQNAQTVPVPAATRQMQHNPRNTSYEILRAQLSDNNFGLDLNRIQEIVNRSQNFDRMTKAALPSIPTSLSAHNAATTCSYLHNNIPKTENNTQTRTQNVPDPARSSLSRDSGIISPPNFANDCAVTSDQGFQCEMAPVITHVTSLNPHASLIESGYCVVCEQFTRKKCMGCFKVYYCSPVCQELNWSVHKYVCK